MRIVNFLLDGKFYTIFSLLLGMGFALQLDRLEKRDAAGTRNFLRRMGISLLIGLIHLSFIWSGDILTIYAFLGFTLPLFHRLTDRALLALAAIFIFGIPILMTQLVSQQAEYWSAPLEEIGDWLWDRAGGPSEESHYTIIDQM